MNTALAVGISLTTVGVAGYLVGLGVAYPGRAFSVTGVMIGITLVAIGRSDSGGGDDGGGGRSGGGRAGSERGGEPT